MYNWQHKNWPLFTFETEELKAKLQRFEWQLAAVTGTLKGMPQEKVWEAVVDSMVAEAIKTSEIEGEYLSREDVKSSILRQLGLDETSPLSRDQRARGIAMLMVEIRQTFKDPLSESRLLEWHRKLMLGNTGVATGEWRSHEDPMQVVSGPLHRRQIHFEAPPSPRVPDEMEAFIQWFNQTAPGEEKAMESPLLRSAIAHLYFESIHPFEDGNGRIGRVLAEKALSQSVGWPVMISLSKAIEKNKKEYYRSLEEAQKTLEITAWLHYFTDMALLALQDSLQLVDFTLAKARFFDLFRPKLNDRQLQVLRRMMQEGPKGFEGGMTARKYMGITKTSKATATRDMQLLTEWGAFLPVGSGRSVRYEIVLPEIKLPFQ